MKKKEFRNKYLKAILCEDDELTNYLMKEILLSLYMANKGIAQNDEDYFNTVQAVLNELLKRCNDNSIKIKIVYSIDNINPEHYKIQSFETIELIRDVIDGYKDPFLAYLVSNTVKYLMRFQYKGKPIEDLKKSIWYISKAMEHAKQRQYFKGSD